MKWFKDNWLIVVIMVVVGLLVWRQVHSATLYDKLMNDYNEQAEAYKKKVAALEKVNEERFKKQAELNKKFQEDTEFIEADFNTELGKLAKQRRKDRNRIVAAAKKDPESMTRAIQRAFGIPVYGRERPKPGDKP